MKIVSSKEIKTLREYWLKQDGNIDPISKRTIRSPALDHCHKSGFCRGVLDRNTNQMLGKVESSFKRFLSEISLDELPNVLRNMANYLENNHSNLELVHYTEITKYIRRFSNLTRKSQIEKLKSLKFLHRNIKDLSKQELIKLYKKHIKESTEPIKY